MPLRSFQNPALLDRPSHISRDTNRRESICLSFRFFAGSGPYFQRPDEISGCPLTFISYTQSRSVLQTTNLVLWGMAVARPLIRGCPRIFIAAWLGFLKLCSQRRNTRHF